MSGGVVGGVGSPVGSGGVVTGSCVGSGGVVPVGVGGCVGSGDRVVGSSVGSSGVSVVRVGSGSGSYGVELSVSRSKRASEPPSRAPVV